MEKAMFLGKEYDMKALGIFAEEFYIFGMGISEPVIKYAGTLAESVKSDEKGNPIVADVLSCIGNLHGVRAKADELLDIFYEAYKEYNENLKKKAEKNETAEDTKTETEGV